MHTSSSSDDGGDADQQFADSIFYNLVYRDQKNISRAWPVKMVQHLSHGAVFVFGYTFKCNKQDRYFNLFKTMMENVFKFKELDKMSVDD